MVFDVGGARVAFYLVFIGPRMCFLAELIRTSRAFFSQVYQAYICVTGSSLSKPTPPVSPPCRTVAWVVAKVTPTGEIRTASIACN